MDRRMENGIFGTKITRPRDGKHKITHQRNGRMESYMIVTKIIRQRMET